MLTFVGIYYDYFVGIWDVIKTFGSNQKVGNIDSTPTTHTILTEPKN